MNSNNWIFMLLICGAVWGGFILCLWLNFRQSDSGRTGGKMTSG